MNIKNLKYSLSAFLLATGITLMSSGCTHQPKIESEVVEETALDLEVQKQIEEENALKNLLFDESVDSLCLYPAKLCQIKDSFPDWTTEEIYQKISNLVSSMPELKSIEIKDFSDESEYVGTFSKNDFDYLSKVLVHAEGLEELSIQLLEPCDLTFLNQLSNLKSLSLEFKNQDEDFCHVLANLTSLEKLSIALHSPKTDLSFLENLTALKELSLIGGIPTELYSNNFVSHIEVLERFSSLTSLTIKKLNLTDQDIQRLSHLTSLEKLDLSGNKTLTDLSALSNLSNLTYLDLSFNQISDIQVLSGFTNLEELDLSFNSITDITPIQSLTSLTILDVGSNEVSDIEGLANLDNLERFDAMVNHISDLSALSSLVNLEDLWLADNQITDLTPLANLKKLEHLTLDGNLITDITPIKDLTELGILDLCENQIDDITPLYSLSRLLFLSLNNNQITDLTPLVLLSRLSYLEINGNQITSIEPLKDLANLKELEIMDNPIEDISIITQFPALEVVDFTDQYGNSTRLYERQIEEIAEENKCLVK